jgi:DNA sulfur modification protein DndB
MIGSSRIASKNGRLSLQEEELAIEFWTEVGKLIPDWQLAQERKVSAAELRRDFIHAHGIALHALGLAGSALIAVEPRRWKERLKALAKVDWSRSSTKTWEGRAMVGGNVSKVHNNVVLTASFLKQKLGIPLSPEEQRVETHFRKRGG